MESEEEVKRQKASVLSRTNAAPSARTKQGVGGAGVPDGAAAAGRH